MESLSVFIDEEWDHLSIMFPSEEDSYTIAHGLFPSNIQTPSTFWATDESSNASPEPVFDEGLFLNYPFSQETNNSSATTSANTNLSFPTPDYESYQNNYSDHFSMDFCVVDDKSNNFLSQVFPDDVMEEIVCLKEAASNMENNFVGDEQMDLPLKRKFEMTELPQAPKEEVVVHIDPIDKNPKKKQRVSRENNKNKKCPQSKKKQKLSTDTNENKEELETNNNSNSGGNGQSAASYCSEEDDSNSNGSQESNGEGALNLNGKTRASRGAATDPQSLYARKRREKINERLRILQNIVPNGTKVDISTMLEEAVHYVKFLQLQIKLLSSDDMWMYAPIAYNGMDMGLYQKISLSAQ